MSENRKKLLQYSLAQIELCIEQESFGRALAHFCVVFKLQPTAKDELKETFLLAVSESTFAYAGIPVWSRRVMYRGNRSSLGHGLIVSLILFSFNKR